MLATVSTLEAATLLAERGVTTSDRQSGATKPYPIDTIIRWCERGLLPGAARGPDGRWRIPVSALDTFSPPGRGRRTSPTADPYRRLRYVLGRVSAGVAEALSTLDDAGRPLEQRIADAQGVLRRTAAVAARLAPEEPGEMNTPAAPEPQPLVDQLLAEHEALCAGEQLDAAQLRALLSQAISLARQEGAAIVRSYDKPGDSSELLERVADAVATGGEGGQPPNRSQP